MGSQYSKLDLSGGMMSVTNHLLRKQNEVELSKNFAYNIVIGSAVRRPGYEKVGRTIEHGKDSLGLSVFRHSRGNNIVAGINNANDSFATLRVLDSGDYWTEILSNASPNTRFDQLNFLEQLYVSGYSADTDTYQPMTNFDSTLVPSTTRNVYAAPACKFIIELNDQILAFNCRVNNRTYKNRAYISSNPTGPVTFIQTDQKGLLKQLRVDSTQYLKVGMTLDIYGRGSENKKVSDLVIISVDKKNKRISFADTTLDVSDNDELWIAGKKNQLSILWNTDDPTPEEADYIEISPGPELDPEFTAATVNANRVLAWTKSSFIVWDGGKVNTVAKTIGCVSDQSVQNIGQWTLWLSHKGVYGYNVVTGQGPKLLSKGMQKYFQSINQTNLSKASAGISNENVYKLAVGELLDIVSATTSTSTSSTSTSSTSSSTSSTSTSSTSTSSTSSSTSQTTTSTSTSSTSTSSTSTSQTTTSTSFSTSSTSSSTSTSSTTTTTAAPTKKVTRFCYDFEMNAWWLEEHHREIRYQVNHTMHGYTKPYFTDDTGRLFRDETGYTDDGKSIPCEIKLGRDQLKYMQRKTMITCMFDAEQARGAVVQYALDGGDFKSFFEIKENIEVHDFPQRGQMQTGRDINYRITHNDKGAPPIINGPTTFFNVIESIPNEAVKK